MNVWSMMGRLVAAIVLACAVTASVHAGTVHYVSPSGGNVAPYTSWADAAQIIQDAVDVAEDGDTVLVTNGVYVTGSRNVGSLATRVAITNSATVQSVNGPAATVILGDKSYGTPTRGAFVGAHAMLAGFTISNSTTLDRDYSMHERSGGGVLVMGGVVSNCTITRNLAHYQGGGLCIQGDGLLTHCLVVDNMATNGGSGVALVGGIMVDCTVTANKQATNGGGVWVSGAGIVSNCTVTGNTAKRMGGGIYIAASSTGVATHCVVSGNSSSREGGGIVCMKNGVVRNCVVRKNTVAPYGGGGIYCIEGRVYNSLVSENNANHGAGLFVSNAAMYSVTAWSNLSHGVYSVGDDMLYNSVIYDNVGDEWGGYNGNPTYMYCCTHPAPPGSDNRTNNPLFVSTSDPHLMPDSPCVDAGTNMDYVYTTRDVEGNLRLCGAVVDMGAYELWRPVPLAITNPVPPVAWIATDTMSVAGTSDHAGVVGWFTNAGSNGLAQGSTTWVAIDIPVPAWSNHVTVWAADALGSTGTAELVVFNDPAAPVVAGANSMPALARAGSVNLSLLFSKPMDTSMPLQVWYASDAQVLSGAFSNRYTWRGAAPVMPGNDGIKTVGVSNAQDVIGISLAATGGLAAFTVDTTPPTPSSLVTPANSSYWDSTTATFEWQPGTDSNGIAGIILSTNGAAKLLPVTNVWSTTVRHGGTYRWAVCSFDYAGNTSAWSDTWEFTVDTNVPTITLTAPSNGMLTNNQPVSLSWMVNSVAPLASNVVTLDGEPLDVALSNEVTVTVTEGTHTWQVQSWNTLDRMGASAVRSFTYDGTPPAVVGVSAIDGSVLHRGVNTVRVDIVDAVSGVDWSVLPEVRLTVGAWPAVRVYHLTHNATQWFGRVYVPHYYGDGTSDVTVGSMRDVAGNVATPAVLSNAFVRVTVSGDAAIPGGIFAMGSLTEPDEQPVHQVCLNDFSLDRREVANEAFAQFVDAGAYTNRACWSDDGWTWRTGNGIVAPVRWNTNMVPMWSTDGYSSQANMPVLGISWYEADAFARWVGRRLPTEAQWEHAARRPSGRAYPWGNSFTQGQTPPVYTLANWQLCYLGWTEAGYTTDGGTNAVPEGTYPAGVSVDGCLDMLGNAREWVADWYADTYATNTWANPPGPSSGTFKVQRGGSFMSTIAQTRNAARQSLAPTARGLDAGFRTAKLPALAVSEYALVAPTAGAELDADAATAIVWHAALVCSAVDGMTVALTRIAVADLSTTNILAEVTGTVANIAGNVTWHVPGALVAPSTNYVVLFEAMDSTSTTVSRVFMLNPFTVVPEPASAATMALCIGIVMRRCISRRLRPAN